MTQIVITGNMGCGKSTAVRAIHSVLTDYRLFDFDAVVRDFYLDSLNQAWLLTEFGTYDKAKISDIVHADADAMFVLREHTDSYVLSRVHIAKWDRNVIFDIPLYFEFNSEMNLTPDLIICVTSDEATQIERVKIRNNFSEEKIRSILAKQLPQEEKVANSDFVLHNCFSSAARFEQFVKKFTLHLHAAGVIA